MKRKYFILVNNGYLIEGFNSKKEVNNYFEKNKDYLQLLNRQDGGDESSLEILSKTALSKIVLDCFFDNTDFDPLRIDAKQYKNLASRFE